VISTPDHWHCIIAIDAALPEGHLPPETGPPHHRRGRELSTTCSPVGRIFQIGASSGRPPSSVCGRLVRNGRIGKLQTVKVGLPGIPLASSSPNARCRKPFAYDPARLHPHRLYTENACIPRKATAARLAPLRAVRAGMITGWGAHHIDSAHWGMDTDTPGRSRSGQRRVPEVRLWECTALREPTPLRERRRDDRQRRVPERDPFEGTEG
jgi:hypothetical protein